MTTQNIEQFVNELKKGTMGIKLISVTDVRMNKTNNPYYGRVKKVSLLTNVGLGLNYENVVNNRLVREGKENNFVAQAPKGKKWLNYPLTLVSEKDENVKYLRTTMYKNTTKETKYIIDNKIANENEIAIMKQFIPKSSKPKNQGLDEENAVIVRDFKFENIYLLKQGKKKFERFEAMLELLFK